jgi:lipid II:glycine glycyltransferase (peptidoglycan interpeptide bridge formation enzyme)
MEVLGSLTNTEKLFQFSRFHKLGNSDIFKTRSQEKENRNTEYGKKFAIMLAASDISQQLNNFFEYSLSTNFDWSVFQDALSHESFDTGDKELNNLVRNSDKSIQFWMSLSDN